MRIRRKSRRPPVMMTCPRSCGSSVTADYDLYCTCPILYFYVDRQTVRMLPYFRDTYNMSLFYMQTDPPPTTAGSLADRLIEDGRGLTRLIGLVSVKHHSSSQFTGYTYTHTHTHISIYFLQMMRSIGSVKRRCMSGSISSMVACLSE